jgi:hypothetical protein
LQELEANIRLAEKPRQDAKLTALGEVLPRILTDLVNITNDSSADCGRADAGVGVQAEAQSQVRTEVRDVVCHFPRDDDQVLRAGKGASWGMCW